MPSVSMFGIVYFTLVTTAKGRDQLLEVGLLLLLATFLHNALGYLLGYWGGRLLGMNRQDSRTIAIEVGTQNGAMGTGLAKAMGKLETVGLAAIIFAPLMNITGSILANYWRRTSERLDKHADTATFGIRAIETCRYENHNFQEQGRSFIMSSTQWFTKLSCALIALIAVTSLPADEPREVLLWPNGLPAGAKPLSQEEVAKLKAAKVDPERIGLVEEPALVVYRAKDDVANGCALVICPGGAYTRLAWVKEGVEVAQYLNTKGVTVGVLKYRVPRRSADEPHREPLQDAQRAMRWMRANATELKIDKDRVGILGFSAGGHLSVMTTVSGDQATYPAADKIDEQSCQPNFLCAIYAAYLGEKYNDTNEVALGSAIKITPKFPPVFLAGNGR